jgi:hypothetical protein
MHTILIFFLIGFALKGQFKVIRNCYHLAITSLQSRHSTLAAKRFVIYQ